MTLGSNAIRRGLADGSLFCHEAPKKIEGTHIDVSLGGFYWSRRQDCTKYKIDMHTSDPKDFYTLQHANKDGSIVLLARTVTLAHTQEFIGTTVADIVPNIDTRSTVARWGLPVHLSAGRGDPGFHSRWTLEIYNPWNINIIAYVGDRVGLVSFDRVEDNDQLYIDRYNAPMATWSPDDMLPRKGNF